MNPWRLGVGIVLLTLAFVAGWRVEAGRVALHEKAALQAQEKALRAEIDRRDTEMVRREKVNADAERNYVSMLKAQGETLDSARNDLRRVRLRVGACPGVPEAVADSTTAGAPDAAGGADIPEDLAELAGNRFARCDAIAAQLNALIKWNRENP